MRKYKRVSRNGPQIRKARYATRQTTSGYASVPYGPCEPTVRSNRANRQPCNDPRSVHLIIITSGHSVTFRTLRMDQLTGSIIKPLFYWCNLLGQCDKYCHCAKLPYRTYSMNNNRCLRLIEEDLRYVTQYLTILIKNCYIFSPLVSRDLKVLILNGQDTVVTKSSEENFTTLI